MPVGKIVASILSAMIPLWNHEKAVSNQVGRTQGAVYRRPRFTLFVSPPHHLQHRGELRVALLEKLASGETIEQILEVYPHLTREGIQAALSFAAETLRSDVVYPTDEAAA